MILFLWMFFALCKNKLSAIIQQRELLRIYILTYIAVKHMHVQKLMKDAGFKISHQLWHVYIIWSHSKKELPNQLANYYLVGPIWGIETVKKETGWFSFHLDSFIKKVWKALFYHFRLHRWQIRRIWMQQQMRQCLRPQEQQVRQEERFHSLMGTFWSTEEPLISATLQKAGP